MEYDRSDSPPSAESAFSPVDIVDEDVVGDDVGYDAGDDLLVPDDDELVIVTDELVIVTDERVIVAQEPVAVAEEPTVVSPGADSRTADNEMAASEIEMALEEIERELVEVERALERLGDGSYGRCQTCGGVLGDEELETAPSARFCSAHLPFEGG